MEPEEDQAPGAWSEALCESIASIVGRIHDMRIKGLPGLDVATNFPSVERFSSAWRSIRDEARSVAQQMHRSWAR
jgi:hypothetical protein